MTHETPPAEQQVKNEPQDSRGEFLWQIFCACIFLGMIGLVSYNAFLRYVFRSSFPASEEWARFLFIYITFFGAIEGFYRKKHIAVDMFTGLLTGWTRKSVDLIAQAFALAAMFLLLWGGVVLVGQTLDTYSVATNVNMTWINMTLPIMAGAALVIRGIDFFKTLMTPASEFKREEVDIQKILEDHS